MEGNRTGVISQSVYHGKVLSCSNSIDVITASARFYVNRQEPLCYVREAQKWALWIKCESLLLKHIQAINTVKSSGLICGLMADVFHPTKQGRCQLPKYQTVLPTTTQPAPLRLKPCPHTRVFFSPASKVRASSTVAASATYPLLFRSRGHVNKWRAHENDVKTKKSNFLQTRKRDFLKIFTLFFKSSIFSDLKIVWFACGWKAKPHKKQHPRRCEQGLNLTRSKTTTIHINFA